MEPASDSEGVDISQYPVRDEVFSVCQAELWPSFLALSPLFSLSGRLSAELSFSFSHALLLSLTTTTTATTILRIQVRVWMTISLCHEAAGFFPCTQGVCVYTLILN